MVKKFTYHGKARELAVTKTTASQITGVEMTYIPTEESKAKLRALYVTFNLVDGCVTDADKESLRPWFPYFRIYKISEINA